MIGAIARGAYHLDTWLQEHVGRPYNALLGVGLVIEIVRGATELVASIDASRPLSWPIFHIALGLALLIHQLGALSHRLEARGEGRRGRRSD
ncbi:MAG TPA: hypothetical protein VMD53_16800 [Rhizomicrobium sp.]|nr:hypothetical protein [Rhizomicrobium sp.]